MPEKKYYDSEGKPLDTVAKKYYDHEGKELGSGGPQGSFGEGFSDTINPTNLIQKTADYATSGGAIGSVRRFLAAAKEGRHQDALDEAQALPSGLVGELLKHSFGQLARGNASQGLGELAGTTGSAALASVAPKLAGLAYNKTADLGDKIIASGSKGAINDVVGMVFPPASHALKVAGRLKDYIDRYK